MDCLKDGFAQKGKMKKLLLTQKQERELFTVMETAISELERYDDKNDKERAKILRQILNKL